MSEGSVASAVIAMTMLVIAFSLTALARCLSA